MGNVILKNAAREEAALITINTYFDIREIDKMHREHGCICVIKDGKCVDIKCEEVENGLERRI